MPDPNIIEKIHLNNVEYNLKDNISGYTTNTGTVTQISTGTGLSGGPITTSGTISHANSGVTAQATQALYPFTVNATGHITGVGSAVTSMTPTSHTHGNITNGGDITTTATIANGDRLVINDESESKVTNSSITFGTSTTQFLANNGTWQEVDPQSTYLLQIGRTIDDTTIANILSAYNSGKTIIGYHSEHGGDLGTYTQYYNLSYIYFGTSSTPTTINQMDFIRVGSGTIIKSTWKSGQGWSSSYYDTGVSDVQINGTSILNSGTANIVTNTAYNASTNKIATMADVDVMTITYSLISGTDYEMNISTVLAPNYANTILGEEY